MRVKFDSALGYESYLERHKKVLPEYEHLQHILAQGKLLQIDGYSNLEVRLDDVNLLEIRGDLIKVGNKKFELGNGKCYIIGRDEGQLYCVADGEKHTCKKKVPEKVAHIQLLVVYGQEATLLYKFGFNDLLIVADGVEILL